MICKKCGKKMTSGARYCIHCGAEHDSFGKLVYNDIDYNKTVMSNEVECNIVGSGNIDYNKTLMANDSSNNNIIDYNKTMMANDVCEQVNQIEEKNNVSNSSNNKRNKGKSKQKSNKSKFIFLLLIIIAICLLVGIIFIKNNRFKKIESNNKNDKIKIETVVETTSFNNVTDFTSSDGYWSQDGESFYRNGTLQKDQWIGDFYLGSNGKKVKNSLIDDTFYVDANGKKVTNEWYMFTKNVDGHEQIVWYYLGEDGAKLKDKITPDGYYVDQNGVYIPGKHSTPDSKNYIPNNN